MKLRDADLLRTRAFIGGRWLDAASGATHAVLNPATREAIGTVPDMGVAETRRAIEAASQAFPAWAALTAKERAAILRRWYELLMANQEDLATLMTAEQGKPLAEAKGEIAYAASFIEWFAEEGKRLPAGGRGRCHHAVELSAGDDHPQGGSGARRRLHDRDQAGEPDALLRTGRGGARRARRRAGRGPQRGHRHGCGGDRR